MSNKTNEHCRNCAAWPQSMFAHVSKDSLDALSDVKTIHNYERGDMLSQQGKPAETVYCLRSGSAKVSISNSGSENSAIVRIVAPGDMLGYRCIFSNEHYRGTASLLEASSACTISRSTIFQLIEREKEFALELLNRMGKEVGAAERQHQSFCQKNVRERVAEGLILLKRKFGKETPSGWRLGVFLTRSEISHWVGASKETVIRCLSDFKDEGLIDQDEDTIVLKDAARLQAIAKLSD